MTRRLTAFVVRLVVSAGVLWFGVELVSPGNLENTFAHAVLISIVLSIAYYLTLAKFLWFLLLPWLLYVMIWLVTVMTSYGLGVVQAAMLALGLVFLSWLVEWLLGVKTFRSE
jgi:putative membrane protein